MKLLYHDPYDVWSVELLGKAKSGLYSGRYGAKAVIMIAGIAEWIRPSLLRKVFDVPRSSFPHIDAMLIKAGLFGYAELALSRFREKICSPAGWGLPFAWYSKNGVYPADTPYITNTPYVMEALLTIASQPELHDEAMALFHRTWRFLESLIVMEEDDQALALSYAPVEEPRIVVNANSYAAYAYAMHFEHGLPERKEMAREKAHKLVRWVIRQQSSDGSWLYYADDEPGNFIDCFHSCFVVKNLLKVKKIFPELSGLVDPAIDRGWRFIRENFPDAGSGLCRRFIKRAQRDPFRWDLYDQAEYLGLLVDFGQLHEARDFAAFVERRFRNGGHWYCRIDLFGRRWGRDFLRWGIVPFWYHKARLDKALEAH